MCGIAGVVNILNVLGAKNVVTQMMDQMIHRGPDDSGLWSDEGVVLGHRRLSIIDLSPGGSQPKMDRVNSNTITFNGEIYNYKQLRSELRDFDFKTNSDTEVILAAYAYWGFDCVRYLKGQFAFAIWDQHKKLLFIARDRVGEKPFYYYQKENMFLFASEVRGLLASDIVKRTIRKDAIVDYLKYQSVNAPYTMLEDVFSLPSASYGIYKDGALVIHKYWYPKVANQVSDQTEYPKVLDTVRNLFSESVKGQMQSDVPLGAFLSGGIDSSAIVAMMATHSTDPVHTFNISFADKGFDESAYANMIAKKFKTEHIQIGLKPTDLLDQLPAILASMDVPSGDGPNTYIIAQAVKKMGLTVALSGLGGDDLFVGYSGFLRYFGIQNYKMFWSLPLGFRKSISGIFGLMSQSNQWNKKRALLEMKDCSLTEFYSLSRLAFNESEIQYLAPGLNSKADFLKENMHQWISELEHFPLFSAYGMAELNGYTQNVLLKDSDNMAMANSLEIRSPFFDHDLISYVFSVSDKLKYPHTPKKLLVDALYPLLPSEVVHRRKMGFSFPWDTWMKNELKPFIDQNIHNLAERDLFDKSRLLHYYADYAKGSPNILWSKIWLLVTLEAWIADNSI